MSSFVRRMCAKFICAPHTAFPCVQTTALGRDVVPDVNWMPNSVVALLVRLGTHAVVFGKPAKGTCGTSGIRPGFPASLSVSLRNLRSVCRG